MHFQMDLTADSKFPDAIDVFIIIIITIIIIIIIIIRFTGEPTLWF